MYVNPLGTHRGLSGIRGGSFSGELKSELPTAEGTTRYLTVEPHEQCIGLRTLGRATAAQLARLQPGGDLYAEYGTGHDIVGGAICELGKETVSRRVYRTRTNRAKPGGWFLHHSGGGTSRIVNPDPAWGPPTGASRGQVTLTGRQDNRTLPWLLEVDPSTAEGSLYFDPEAPPTQADTAVTALDPEGERVAELRVEQETRREALRRQIERTGDVEPTGEITGGAPGAAAAAAAAVGFELRPWMIAAALAGLWIVAK